MTLLNCRDQHKDENQRGRADSDTLDHVMAKTQVLK